MHHFFSGKTDDSEKAGSTDYPAGSAREGELLEGEEQPRSNATKGTRTSCMHVTILKKIFYCGYCYIVPLFIFLSGERKPFHTGTKILRPHWWPGFHSKGGRFDRQLLDKKSRPFLHFKT